MKIFSKWIQWQKIHSREIKIEQSSTERCNTWNVENFLDGLNKMEMMKESVNLKMKYQSWRIEIKSFLGNE